MGCIMTDQREEFKYHLRKFIRIIYKPIIIVDEESKIVMVNEQFKDIFNIEKYQIRKGMPISSAIGNLGNIYDFMVDALDSKCDGVTESITWNDYYFDVSISNISGRTYDYYVFLFHDITEKENMDIFRKKFTSNVAHELRTPLTAIGSMAELIAYNEKISIEQMRSEARIIYDEVGRLSKLVNELLQISKYDANTSTTTKKIFSTTELVEYVNQTLKYKLEERQIKLIKQVQSIDVFADFNECVQVLTNIIGNACIYAKTSVKVTIYTSIKDIIIEIEDDGIGMTQKQINHVFERFYRTDASRARNLGGTGLGLSIVKEICDKNNWEIKIRSKIKEYTKFKIKIPKDRT